MPNYGSASAKLPVVSVGPGVVELAVLKQEQVFHDKIVFWKYFCPTGGNWSVRNPSMEDRDLGHHTQSHGVGAIQVNRDL